MPVSVRQSPELKKWFLEGYAKDPSENHPASAQKLSRPAKRALWLGLAILAGFATAENMLQNMNTSLFHASASASIRPSDVKSSNLRSITPSESKTVSLQPLPSDTALDLLDEEALAKRHDRTAKPDR